MGISFLTILVFYLPSDSGEKVSATPLLSFLLPLITFINYKSFFFFTLQLNCAIILGFSKYFDLTVVDRVFLVIGGNYSTHIVSCATFREICIIHHDLGYIQVIQQPLRPFRSLLID